jgi:hypothetical protein
VFGLHLALLLVADYEATISRVAFIGEVLLMLWLLWKGFTGLDEESVAEGSSPD